MLNYKKPAFWVTLIALVAAVAVGIFLLTSPGALTDQERCGQALKDWQAMDAYHFIDTQSNAGEMALHDTSNSEYWSSGGEYLQKFEYADGMGWWQHWRDGRGYTHQYGSEDADFTDTGWHGEDFAESAVIPWVMRLDWDALTVHGCETPDEGKTVVLTVDFPVLGPGTLTFHFDDHGDLSSVSRSFTSADSTVCTGTIELVDTDRAQIGTEILNLGAAPELGQLYSELERIQGLENVHLVIDTKLDSDYPGWNTGRQEFIRCGGDYYRNSEYKNSKGSYATSYLNYGGTLYAREYSDEGIVPNRDWEVITDRGFDEIYLLTRDWSQLGVLEIQRLQDGSSVITLQGDLDASDSNTSYYSRIYEFHLNPEGILTASTHNTESKMVIDDYFAQGVYECAYKATIHILDTPKTELTARIEAVAGEVRATLSSGDVQAELAQKQEELRLAGKCYDAYSGLLSANSLHLITVVEDSSQDGPISFRESFYSGTSYCFESWDGQSDTSVEKQAVRMGIDLYSSVVQGSLCTGWQTQELTDEYSYHPRQKLEHWNDAGLLSAAQEGDEILLTFAGEPGTLVNTDYYTADGYTVRFRFEDDRLAEVTWEYDVAEEGVQGTAHRKEIYRFPGTSADEIELRIHRMHAETYHPCTFPYEELMGNLDGQWTVKEQGFRNTAPATLESRADAISIAANELTADYHTADVFYDPSAKVWMVRFGLYTMGDFLVFLNADGTTCTTIQFPTGTVFTLLNHTCENPVHNHYHHSDHHGHHSSAA